jgi:hypothetical protein
MKKKIKILVTAATFFVVSASVPTVALTASRRQVTVANNEAMDTATISNSNFFNLSNIMTAVTAVQNIATTAQNVIGNVQQISRQYKSHVTTLYSVSAFGTYPTSSPYTTWRFLADGENRGNLNNVVPNGVLPRVSPGKMNVILRFARDYLEGMTVGNLDLSLEKYPYRGYESYMSFSGVQYSSSMGSHPDNKGELYGTYYGRINPYYQEIAMDVSPGEKVTDSFIGNLFQFTNGSLEFKSFRWMDARTGFEVTTFSHADVGKTILLVPMVPKRVRISVDSVVLTTLPMSQLIDLPLSNVPVLARYLNIPFNANNRTPGLKTYYYDIYDENIPMSEKPISKKNTYSITGWQAFSSRIKFGLPITPSALYSPYNNTGSEISKDRPLELVFSNNSTISNKVEYADTFELNLRTVR